MHIKYKKITIGIPAALISGADATITLIGQSSAYWTDHSKFNEGNPLAAYFLNHGPSFFIIYTLGWMLLILAATLVLPRFLSLLCASSFVVGHGFGFLTWLLFSHQINFNWIYLYFPAMTAVVLWQARFYYRQIAPPKGSTEGVSNG
jgi:hypothetical protein